VRTSHAVVGADRSGGGERADIDHISGRAEVVVSPAVGGECVANALHDGSAPAQQGVDNLGRIACGL